jgi:hypothetical protein
MEVYGPHKTLFNRFARWFTWACLHEIDSGEAALWRLYLHDLERLGLQR